MTGPGQACGVLTVEGKRSKRQLGIARPMSADRVALPRAFFGGVYRAIASPERIR